MVFADSCVALELVLSLLCCNLISGSYFAGRMVRRRMRLALMQRRRGMDPTRTKMLRTPSRRRKGVSPISRRKFVLPVTACLLMTSYKGLFYVFISLKNCFWFVLFQLQRRMKIAELKQICARPDVVEVVCLV